MTIADSGQGCEIDHCYLLRWDDDQNRCLNLIDEIGRDFTEAEQLKLFWAFICRAFGMQAKPVLFDLGGE
jgi:hypothetical protein